MFICLNILEFMVVLVFPTSELMQFMIPPLELVQGGVQELVIVELIMMVI